MIIANNNPDIMLVIVMCNENKDVFSECIFNSPIAFLINPETGIEKVYSASCPEGLELSHDQYCLYDVRTGICENGIGNPHKFTKHIKAAWAAHIKE